MPEEVSRLTRLQATGAKGPKCKCAISVLCKAQTSIALRAKIFQVFPAEGKVSSLKHFIVFCAVLAPSPHNNQP